MAQRKDTLQGRLPEQMSKRQAGDAAAAQMYRIAPESCEVRGCRRRSPVTRWAPRQQPVVHTGAQQPRSSSSASRERAQSGAGRQGVHTGAGTATEAHSRHSLMVAWAGRASARGLQHACPQGSCIAASGQTGSTCRPAHLHARLLLLEVLRSAGDGTTGAHTCTDTVSVQHASTQRNAPLGCHVDTLLCASLDLTSRGAQQPHRSSLPHACKAQPLLTRHKDVHLALGGLPDLRARGLVVDGRVGCRRPQMSRDGSQPRVCAASASGQAC